MVNVKLSRFAIIAVLMAGVLLWIGFETNLHVSLSREGAPTASSSQAAQ